MTEDPNEAEKRQRIADGSWLQDWPGRPNTPEHWRLSDLVLQLDAESNEPDFDLSAVLPTDLKSLVYMAEQRFGIFTQRLGLPDDPTERALFVAGYLEAFTLGHRYHDNPPGPGWTPSRTPED